MFSLVHNTISSFDDLCAGKERNGKEIVVKVNLKAGPRTSRALLVSEGEAIVLSSILALCLLILLLVMCDF